ncbi:hypothetical protein M8818_005254 [Zalaria obscura]|uniref:Uncharacterized protein n=1 Tax=Zalaria obscura TaxID=2024903 RepID=A0ACC3SCP7_9PEZI
MQATRLISRTPLVARSTLPLRATSLRTFSLSSTMSVKVSEGITHDHRELEEYKNNILSAKDNDDKVKWQNQFTWELARHSIAEELVVYPAMEKYVPGGKDMAEKDRDEHQTVKELLYKFQKLEPTDPDFEPTIKTLWDNLSAHIKEEEEHDLPALEKHLAADDSESLAASFDRTKMFTPTRQVAPMESSLCTCQTTFRDRGGIDGRASGQTGRFVQTLPSRSIMENETVSRSLGRRVADRPVILFCAQALRGAVLDDIHNQLYVVTSGSDE